MLEKTLPIIFVFVLCYLLKAKKVIDKKESKFLGDVLINIVIPAVIITAFSGIKIEPSLIYLPAAGFVVVISLSIIGYFIAKLMKLERKTFGTFVTLFPTFEGGIIGYSIMLSAFGELGLSRIVLYDFANALFMFTVVYFMACRYGNEKAEAKEAIMKILKTPILWAIFVGLFLNLTGFSNALLSNTLDVIGSSLLLLAMMLLGLEFEPNVSSFKLPAITLVLKTMIGFSLGWAISAVFGFSGIEKTAILVWASLPPAIGTLIFAQENNLDTQYAASLFSIALPLSLIYLTAMMNFL